MKFLIGYQLYNGNAITESVLGKEICNMSFK